MSSVSSTNPALTNLLQTLSTAGAPAAQSQADVNGLQNASPGDIADLSEAANRLAEANATFSQFYGFEMNGSQGTDQGSDQSVLEALQSTLSASAQADTPGSSPSVDLLG